MEDMLIYNARLVDANMDEPGGLLIQNGRITDVLRGNRWQQNRGSANVAARRLDARSLCVMPSFIDMHAHFRTPGFEYKEDTASGIHAAIAGGYSTVVCMANTMPAVSSQEAAIQLCENARKIAPLDLFQAVSLTRDFNGRSVDHLEKLDASIVPLVSEDGKDIKDPYVMLKAMKIASKKGLVVSCHCEDMVLSKIAKKIRGKVLKALSQEGLRLYSDIVKRHITPPDYHELAKLLSEASDILAVAEDIATSRNIRLAQKAACHIHVAHCSTATAMQTVRYAKAQGQNVSVEVTPHHIAKLFDADYNEFLLVNPPIRKPQDREALIEALLDGTCDVIACDHAPHSTSDKDSGAPGFSGLETSFAVCYTNLVKTGIISLKRLSQLMSANPSRILRLDKGTLEVGRIADIVFCDINAKWTVDSSRFKSKGHMSPFDNMELYGLPKGLICHGEIVAPLPSSIND